VREIAAALAAAGQDDGLVQHMPHRAIRWRAEHDKLGYEDISPISAPARAALEACTAIPAPGGPDEAGARGVPPLGGSGLLSGSTYPMSMWRGRAAGGTSRR
jgi:hypothetical protein